MFNDFFSIFLTNKDIFFKFPFKDLFTQLNATKVKNDLATKFAAALFSIKTLIEKNKKNFELYESPLVASSTPESIILFLYDRQQNDLLKTYLALLFKMNISSLIEKVVLRILAKNNTELFQFLVEQQFDFAGFVKDGQNLLHYAVQYSSTKLIEPLMAVNVDMNAPDGAGIKPFEMPIKSNIAKMKAILEKHAPKEPSQLLVQHGLFEQQLNISEVISDEEFYNLIHESGPK